MTRGGDATPEPFDLSEISRSGDLFDDLAARRVPDLTADDPAVRLLAALVADVDAGAPPLPARPPRVACAGAKPGRPVVRAFVTFGAATLILATAGAAAAGGGAGQGPKADGPAVQRLDVSERSKGDVAAHTPPIGRRTAPADGDDRAGDPATGAGRDRHNAVPAGRSQPPVARSERPGVGSSRPPGGRGGVVGPITSGRYAPAPSLSPSSPSSPPTSSEPPASPPADPTDGPSPSPGSGLRDHTAAIEYSARHAGVDGARAGAAAPDGSDQERTTAGQDRTTT